MVIDQLPLTHGSPDGALTIRVKKVVLLSPPPVEVTVIVYVPAGVVVEVLMVSVIEQVVLGVQ